MLRKHQGGGQQALLIIPFLLLLLYSFAFADIIYLKNGKQIQCDSAWEEGKEVKYNVDEGTIGIPKAMVAKIVKQESETPQEVPNLLQQQVKQNPGASKENVRELEKQVSNDPTLKSKISKIYVSLALNLVNKKDFPGALENFQKAYQFEKNRTTILNLALTYYMLKDDWNAQLYFNELLRLDGNDTIALNYLGEIAWRGEDLEATESYWKKSLEVRHDKEIEQKLKRLKKEKTASSNYENASSRHFLLKYDGGVADPNLVTEISDFLEEVYQDLSSRFDAYPTAPFVVVMYPRQQFFKATDAPNWSGGANDGKIKLPVRGMTSLNDAVRDTLKHELVHSFVNFKTSENCPSWLQEGLAQWIERKSVGPEGTKVLATLVTANQLPSIRNLSGGFKTANEKTATVLYLQSLSFTNYLIDKYRFHTLNALLDELGNGTSFDEAFENTFAIPVSRVEQDWVTDLTNQ
jgi:tetratricopeptide (TPR) repeat protein